MGELIVATLAYIYLITGLLYALFEAVNFTHKPQTVGDLVVRLIFLPFTIIIYVVWAMMYFVEVIIMPILNSNLWNKKL